MWSSLLSTIVVNITIYKFDILFYILDDIYFPQLEIIGDISENLKLLADKVDK